jgi:1-deoxy-D-xylulose 5-phosphate reductoisomerase
MIYQIDAKKIISIGSIGSIGRYASYSITPNANSHHVTVMACDSQAEVFAAKPKYFHNHNM